MLLRVLRVSELVLIYENKQKGHMIMSEPLLINYYFIYCDGLFIDPSFKIGSSCSQLVMLENKLIIFSGTK